MATPHWWAVLLVGLGTAAVLIGIGVLASFISKMVTVNRGGEAAPGGQTLAGMTGAAAFGLGLGWQLLILTVTAYMVHSHLPNDLRARLPGWLQMVAFPALVAGIALCYAVWMRGCYYVTAKELRTYFTSPIAYVVMMAVFGISGLIFFLTLRQWAASEAREIGGTFMTNCFILLLISPLLTMRLFAEEKRSGTYEVLMTHPVGDLQVVVGKFVAAAGVMLVILGALLIQPVLLQIGSGKSMDWGPVWSCYLGLVGWALAFAAIGVFTSALTNSQIAAAAMSWFILLALWLMGALRMVEPGKMVSKIGEYLSISGVMEGFSQGKVDTTSLVYLASVTIFFLFAATMTLFTNRSR